MPNILFIVKRVVACFASSVMLIAVATTPVEAQSLGYTKLNIKNRVQLEIPDDWTINDAEHRKQVKENSEQVSGIPNQHTASLSVKSYPAPSRVFVRVSFLKIEPSISQAEVRKEVQADRQQVIRDFAGMWKETAPAMWAELAKYGVMEVGRATFAVEPLGGQTALVIRTGRTSTVNPTETMRVAQYHIPLGDEKALISLSYIEGDKGAVTAHDRLKNSIAIR